MLAQVSNTMDQVWLTLTQARDVLTQARNALTEARFVADETWSGWARRGGWTCKWMWAAGLGGNMGLGGCTEDHCDVATAHVQRGRTGSAI